MANYLLAHAPQVPASQHKPGTVIHTMGYPLDHSTYGGGFLYHMADNKVRLRGKRGRLLLFLAGSKVRLARQQGWVVAGHRGWGETGLYHMFDSKAQLARI